MDKVVEACTRVEGHGNLNIYLKNNEIYETELNFSVFRGFENILVGKKLLDIPKIVSRICGLCYASQTIASCKAIEDIYGIEPSHQSILLRRLLLSGELIKSHIMHYFFQSFPDLLKIFKNNTIINEYYNLINYNPHLTTNFFNLIKIGTEINTLIGGRVLHPITPFPGGLIFNPTRKNLILIEKYLKKGIYYIEAIIENFIDLFSAFDPPTEFNLSNPIYFGLKNNMEFDRYEGDLRIEQNETTYEDFQAKNYSKYFDKDPNLYGIMFKSNSRNKILTGPLARYKLTQNYGIDKISEYINNFGKKWKSNLLFLNFLQLIECYYEIQKSVEILDTTSLKSKTKLKQLKSIKKSNGIGVIEAPRGILMHHYHLNKAKIVDQVKLFIATEINLPILNKMITEYAKKLYEKEDIDSVKEKIQIMIRAFDPCISCASH
ncbi:MAG: nickel-dependent hydrogenase large subunit [Candidatus Lokiarchaeota archaeon]|nr:nickel-dependent hydrogenase large subunit [Candidatus Lokiarchaeota archaeon]